jgi:hypothetical protein
VLDRRDAALFVPARIIGAAFTDHATLNQE